jgi:plasmid stabilization system protein ParE
MVSSVSSVVWTKRAQLHLRQAFDHISIDAPQNAAKVITDIIEAVDRVVPNPEIYPPDKYKTDNSGSYRAFEKHHYRVSYKITNGIARILRVRHTSRIPDSY